MKVRNKGGEKEKSDEGKNENERTVVVVGMKMNDQSREILTWALVKVSQPGDLVMALHVLPSSSFSSDGTDSALKAFNSVIAAYDDFCNLKQINLSFSICHGSSARKAIVHEVERFQASKLVLGASNHSHGIGTASTSFARYCSTKLSDDCTVLAINNGKVVFRRIGKVEANNSNGRKLRQSSTSSNSLTVVDGSNENSFCLLPASKHGNKNGREVDRSSNKKPIILEASNDNSFCLLPTRKYGNGNGNGRELHHSSSTEPVISNDNSFCLLPTRKYGNGNGSEEHHSSSKKPMFLEASNDNSFCVLPHRKIGHSNVNLTKEKTLPSTRKNEMPEKDSSDAPQFKEEGQVHSRNSENTPQSLSALLQTSPESKKHGWPRLKKEKMYNKSNSVENPKTSVVQWAMRLPSRYSSVATTVCPCQRPETMAKQSSDSSSGETIPLGMDDSCDSSDAMNDEGSPKVQKELEDLREKYGSTCRLFNYQELVDATSNFSPYNLIGKGGSSRVYKGVLRDNQDVAVKILKKSQALEEFVMEIKIITLLHHKNIISLSGFFFNSKNLVLVYNFLSRGSLGDNLHGLKKSENPIGWVERFKIAVGVAEALDYLHSHGGESPLPVIHSDVKSSNILLSDDFHPQLSDFGLATWCSSPASSDTPRSDVAGTFGYLAPEYLMLGKVSEKIDVYAFGVVLLELLSGRMPIENEHLKGHQSLVMWAKPILRSGKFMKLLDQDLGSVYDEDQAERMILAASLCITRAPRLRPKMVTVLEILRGNNEELLKWAKLQVNDAWGEMEVLDDDESVTTCSPNEFQSHLNLALLDVEDDDELSVSSIDQTLDHIMSHVSLEAYLQDRRSSSTSFN